MSNEKTTQQILEFLLISAEIDLIKISSTAVLIVLRKNFRDITEYVYLSTDAKFTVGEIKLTTPPENDGDFFKHRAAQLGGLYLQIPKTIVSCEIGDNGMLTLGTGDAFIQFYPTEGDNSETIWDVYDGDEYLFGKHNACVSLDDSLNVSAFSD